MALPRYGLGAEKYIASNSSPTEDEERIIDNLTRAGARLRGFARSGLFKRLESGGDTFLLSIRRHIIRNAVYLYCLKQWRTKASPSVKSSRALRRTRRWKRPMTMLCPLGDDLSGVETWKVAGSGQLLYEKLKEDRRLNGQNGLD